MRKRGTNETSLTHQFFTDFNPDGSVYRQVGPSLTPFGWAGRSTTIEDDPHPNFAKDIRMGKVVLGELYRYISSRTYTQAIHDFGPHPDWGRCVIVGDLAGCMVTTYPLDEQALQAQLSSMQANAIVKAFAKLNDAPVLIGEAMSDLSKTSGMLKRPFGAALNLLSRMEKRRSKLLRTLPYPKATAQCWLEYRYGWRPLIMDVNAIVKQATARVQPPGWVRRVARSQVSLTTAKSNECAGTNSRGFGMTGTATFKRKLRASAGVIYDLKINSSLEEWQKTLGARASDIPATLWEIIPYSFVVDWFVGIGTWIQAVTPDPNVSVRGSWNTTVDESINTIDSIVSSITLATVPPVTFKTGGGSSEIKSVSIRRLVNQPLPSLPSLVGTSLTANQTLDGLALTATQIIGKLQGFAHSTPKRR